MTDAADGERLVTKVMIVNELGLHARAATQLVKLAAKFPCSVKIGKDDSEVDGKSIMGVLMLVASKGTEIAIITEGDQAEAAQQALVELVRNRFGEDK